MTNRIYLDVDGVLNALPVGDSLENTGWSDDSWKTEEINGYVITWSTELVDALNELSARDDVEFRWLTTWCEDAQTEIAPTLGLAGGRDWPLTDGLTQIEAMYASYRGRWWKMVAIENELEQENADKIVWVDDDHTFYKSQNTDWVTARTNSAELLVVCPRLSEGITKPLFEQIRDFLDA